MLTEAQQTVAEIMADVEQGSNKPGHASATMKQFVAIRWNEADDRDTLLTAEPGDSKRTQAGHRRAQRQHPGAVEA